MSNTDIEFLDDDDDDRDFENSDEELEERPEIDRSWMELEEDMKLMQDASMERMSEWELLEEEEKLEMLAVIGEEMVMMQSLQGMLKSVSFGLMEMERLHKSYSDIASKKPTRMKQTRNEKRDDILKTKPIIPNQTADMFMKKNPYLLEQKAKIFRVGGSISTNPTPQHVIFDIKKEEMIQIMTLADWEKKKPENVFEINLLNPKCIFSIFHRHNSSGLPIPGALLDNSKRATTISAIWEGLKIWADLPLDMSLVLSSNPPNKSRIPISDVGRWRGWKTLDKDSEILNAFQARKQIMLPLFRYVLEKYCKNELAFLQKLLLAKKTTKLILIDSCASYTVFNSETSRSFPAAALLKLYLLNRYPTCVDWIEIEKQNEKELENRLNQQNNSKKRKRENTETEILAKFDVDDFVRKNKRPNSLPSILEPEPPIVRMELINEREQREEELENASEFVVRPEKTLLQEKLIEERRIKTQSNREKSNLMKQKQKKEEEESELESDPDPIEILHNYKIRPKESYQKSKKKTKTQKKLEEKQKKKEQKEQKEQAKRDKEEQEKQKIQEQKEQERRLQREKELEAEKQREKELEEEKNFVDNKLEDEPSEEE